MVACHRGRTPETASGRSLPFGTGPAWGTQTIRGSATRPGAGMTRLMRRRRIGALTRVARGDGCRCRRDRERQQRPQPCKVRVPYRDRHGEPRDLVTRTFSFVGPSGSKTATVVSIDGLTINARCNTSGGPVIFAFSSVAKSDILGRFSTGRVALHFRPQHVVRPRGSACLCRPPAGTSTRAVASCSKRRQQR